MKIQVWVLSLIPLSCADVGESKLSLTVEPARLVADGQSGASVRVCNDSSEPADVTATLRASVGAWDGAPESETRSIDLALTGDAPCDTAIWLPPSRTGQVRFEVEVGGVVRVRDSRSLVKAEVSEVEIQGALLSEEAVSAIELTADITTATGGDATQGTIVELRVESEPKGMAYVSNDSIIVGKRDRVMLYAPAGTESVQVRAVVVGAEDVTACRQFSTTSIQSCP